MSNPDKKVTKTIKKEIVLPGQTEIYQSNRITNGKFKGFTLMQSKILMCLIKGLQVAIRADMSGADWKQMKLFEELGNNTLRIGLPLADVTIPQHYIEVYKATEDMASLKVRLKKSPMGKEYFSSVCVIPRVEFPKVIKGKSVMYIEIYRDVAEKLIEIEKNRDGQPQFYTKYLYEVGIGASNKYAYKLYMIIASWKSKASFSISLNELREQLGIDEEEYKEYADFKRRVLLPVQKYLEKKADCWYNCTEPGFETRERKKVTSLNFKVIVPEIADELLLKADHIRNLLKMHFKFEASHIEAVSVIFKNLTREKVGVIMEKLMALKTHRQNVTNTEDIIKNVAAYTLTALLKAFSN